jgi:sigma-E factor negative regulatory protein RseB
MRLLRDQCLGFFAIIAAVAASLAPTFAQAENNLMALQRMAQASRQLTYEGVFVYRSADRMETSHIAHTWADGRDLERIEVLDGSPREMIRNGDEITSFFPIEKRLIVETRSTHRQFPTLLPAGLNRLQDNYSIRSSGQGRVAGLNSRVIVLEPRDNLRYGHEFWLDNASGLLLRAVVLGGHGETLDSFSFTQIAIGGSLPRQLLKPRFPNEGLQVQKITTTEIVPEDLGWVFHKKIPGFRRINAMKRQSGSGQPALHILFSDGVATISAFIEPRADTEEPEQNNPAVLSSMGALNVYHRQTHQHYLVVMGEVPVLTLKQLGDGIEWRKE